MRDVEQTKHEEKVQEEIVKSPGASEVLVNSCSPRKEKSEVLRNETLLLLARCTKGHSEIQKLVAFEGMFEVAFDIIRARNRRETTLVMPERAFRTV